MRQLLQKRRIRFNLNGSDSKARFGADGLVVLGELGTALTLVLLGFASQPLIGVSACIIAGISWIAAISSLNISAQVALPDWVRGRGLAMYVTVFFAVTH